MSGNTVSTDSEEGRVIAIGQTEMELRYESAEVDWKNELKDCPCGRGKFRVYKCVHCLGEQVKK